MKGAGSCSLAHAAPTSSLLMAPHDADDVETPMAGMATTSGICTKEAVRTVTGHLQSHPYFCAQCTMHRHL